MGVALLGQNFHKKIEVGLRPMLGYGFQLRVQDVVLGRSLATVAQSRGLQV